MLIIKITPVLTKLGYSYYQIFKIQNYLLKHPEDRVVIFNFKSSLDDTSKNGIISIKNQKGE